MNSFVSSIQQLGLSTQQLIDEALRNGEGVLSSTGALSVTTGKRTGRSPKDRFIVRDEITTKAVDWGPINQAIAPEVFTKLWKKACNYLETRKVYVSDLQIGADEKFSLPVKVITELAWHNVFVRNLFIRDESNHHDKKTAWTILNASSLKTNGAEDGVNSDGVVIINFKEQKILLIGMQYAGEMKKAMFTVLNFILPEHDVLPMHCAANMGKDGDTALFFGLSGTGKTTLSADPERLLIGDDEHGWSRTNVFNFEGGCYAKCIDLSKEREPVIWDAIKTGTIMENVVLKPTGEPDYHDSRITENTRAAYPREHIELRVEENKGQVPSAVIFLTCDLYGVLPPVALLTKEQAAYYFLSGYTALVGSTEVGSSAGVSPTFSRCFGAPFFPRPATEYAALLMRRIEETGVKIYLVNTGWTGGAYGQGGQRFSIPTTRAVVSAIVKGKLATASTKKIPIFNFYVPEEIVGVDKKYLDPRDNWQNLQEYESCARMLAKKFQENMAKFSVDQQILQAGPD